MSFDVSQFLNTTYEAEMETDYTLVPEGEYRCNIDDIDAKPGKLDDGVSVMLTLKLNMHDEELKKLMNRDPFIWNYVIFLDVDENYTLQYGKNQNIPLGRIRKAIGKNNPNKKFSLGDLANSSDMIIKVTHSQDKKDPSKSRANIVEWAAA